MSRRLLKRRGARDNPWLVGKVSLEADRRGGQPVGVFRVTESGVGGVGGGGQANAGTGARPHRRENVE